MTPFNRVALWLHMRGWHSLEFSVMMLRFYPRLWLKGHRW